MKIIIAPDSFKGSLTALEVCEAASRGIAAMGVSIETVSVPMADGGEGTVQSLVDATGGRFVSVRVSCPLGEEIEASYGLLGDGVTAVIEMAAASGLPLVPPGKCNPLYTTTYGTGQLMKAALDAGARKLIVGIGGSATTDGGLGMAAALGARLLDERGEEVAPTGSGLAELASIDLSDFDSRIASADIRVACDVDNPLYGPQGAAYVYGPQKGATPEQVAELDRALAHYADIMAQTLGRDERDVPGVGAAGGLGFALRAVLGAAFRPGIEMVAELSGLEQAVRGADLVITGEGRLDGQSLHGKTPVGVARIAAAAGVPVIALAGSLGEGYQQLYDAGIQAAFSLAPGPLSLQQAMSNAEQLLSARSEDIARLWRLASR